MNKIRIEQIKDTPHFRVYLDGNDISKFTRHLSLDFGVGKLPEAVITLVVPVIEIPDELEAIVAVTREHKAS